MDIKERAKLYAEGKALEAITSAIEQAYADGYTAGCKDGLDYWDNLWKSKMVNSVEYVDLNLPSGTLWSSHILISEKNTFAHMTYDEAAQLSIPTEEQFKELLDNCETSVILDKSKTPIGVSFIGRNGNIIEVFYDFTIHGKDQWPNSNYRFWLRDNTSTDNERICAYFKESRQFMGDRLPVMLVLSPEQKK